MGRALSVAFFLVAAFLCIHLPLGAQTPDAEAGYRAPVWIYIEPVPGSTIANPAIPSDGTLTDESRLAIYAELDSVGRFVMGGIIYGWRFSYTPPDNLRKVDEEFILEPLYEIPAHDPRFTLTGLEAGYPRLSAWAQFTPDAASMRWKAHWDSVAFRSSEGRGYGERSDETKGIRDAYAGALMQAVREHARKLEKNKPKEIHGELLLENSPRLFVDEGRFVADVRILLKISEIIPYRTF